MSLKKEFNKKDIDMYLEDFAMEYKKLSPKNLPLKIVLVGGASVLLNYNFRKSTGDIDCLKISSSSIKIAIEKTSKKYGIGSDWLNDDFINTSSYSEKINDISILYKNISKKHLANEAIL